MKKLVLLSIASVALLCSCSDEKQKNTDKTGDSTSLDSLQNGTAAKPDTVIWFSEGPNDNIGPGDNLCNWGHATFMCPEGYRLPSLDEFRKSPQMVKELSMLTANSEEDRSWWTIQLASFNSDTIAPKAIAVRFQGDSIISTEEDVSQEKYVVCVKKNEESYPINPVSPNVVKKSGVIEDVQFKPYYEASLENLGCADCCCEEGNGAIQKVTYKTNEGELDTFQVRELDPKFCGAIAFDGQGNPTDLQTEDCESIQIEKFNILQLFQTGMKVQHTSCSTPIYITSSVGNEYAKTTCGETINLEFTGVLQEISLVQREDQEEDKKCSYTIKLLDANKVISATAPCSNAELGQSYNIQVTITLDPVVSKNDSPVLKMEYPCCYDEWQSHQVTDISFTSSVK